MQISKFKETLEAAAPGLIHETAAPKGLLEYAIWHEYAPRTLVGDDIVQLEAPRVQIDVIWQSNKLLLKTVKDCLGDMGLAYEVVEHGYDDEWQSMRCILQLEVL